MVKLTNDIRRSLQGALPGSIITVSKDGIPNVTYVSQVWYVDEEHLAISLQYLNKTAQNVRENPKASILAIDPNDFTHWMIEGEFERCETEGAIFEEMKMQLEVVASMLGMSDVLILKGADIYHVTKVTRLPVAGVS
jgi:predicted pyridoxine 5'-phosphate oxidase superfamily flavin-nucleotide-binding protein